MAKVNKQVIVTINPESHVYGKKNTRITGDYTCDKDEADRLIKLGDAEFKEEIKSTAADKSEETVKDKK